MAEERRGLRTVEISCSPDSLLFPCPPLDPIVVRRLRPSATLTRSCLSQQYPPILPAITKTRGRLAADQQIQDKPRALIRPKISTPKTSPVLVLQSLQNNHSLASVEIRPDLREAVSDAAAATFQRCLAIAVASPLEARLACCVTVRQRWKQRIHPLVLAPKP